EEIIIVISINRSNEKTQIFAEFISNHVTSAPNVLVTVMPIAGRNLSTSFPNFGAKSVATIPAGKYAQVTS
ncbi:MAG: hypothetical protein ACTSQL_11095, partial [Promethearchaeota archaeon]